MSTVKVLLLASFAIVTVIHDSEPINGQARQGVPPATAPTQPPLPLRPLQPIDGVSMEAEGRFTVTDPRPLARAAELLERKLGIPISYEEPAWASNGDIVHAADLPQNRELATNYPDWRGPLVPRSSTAEVILPTKAAERQVLGAASIIQAVLDSHRSRRNPGEFKLIPLNDGAFSIVCEYVEDAAGRRVEHTSPLDLKISFQQQERSISETLDVLVQAINTLRTVRLQRPTMGGKGYFDAARVRVGAQNELARDVLVKILKTPGHPKFSWTVTYMPDLQVYLLGLRRAQVEMSVPGAGVQLLELDWPKQ